MREKNHRWRFVQAFGSQTTHIHLHFTIDKNCHSDPHMPLWRCYFYLVFESNWKYPLLCISKMEMAIHLIDCMLKNAVAFGLYENRNKCDKLLAYRPIKERNSFAYFVSVRMLCVHEIAFRTRCRFRGHHRRISQSRSKPDDQWYVKCTISTQPNVMEHMNQRSCRRRASEYTLN